MTIDNPARSLYRTLQVAESDPGVLSVVIDAPPMNLIGPELVRDLVTLVGEVESGQDVRVMVLESADPEYFVPHVDLRDSTPRRWLPRRCGRCR
jgi:enoyl-CoA hydratase/carnithine racemase